jgi:hypothetical protein
VTAEAVTYSPDGRANGFFVAAVVRGHRQDTETAEVPGCPKNSMEPATSVGPDDNELVWDRGIYLTASPRQSRDDAASWAPGGVGAGPQTPG